MPKTSIFLSPKGRKGIQKQPPSTVLDVRKTPSTSPIGIDVNRIKFESDRQPDQDLDTPLQREIKLYISGRFSDPIYRTGRSKDLPVPLRVKLPSSRNLDWNKTLLPIEKRQKLMCRDRKHDLDTPVDIEDGYLDEDSSSSDDISNAVRYVPTSSGSPVKVLSRAEKREALGVENPVLSYTSGKILIYRKV